VNIGQLAPKVHYRGGKKKGKNFDEERGNLFVLMENPCRLYPVCAQLRSGWGEIQSGSGRGKGKNRGAVKKTLKD